MGYETRMEKQGVQPIRAPKIRYGTLLGKKATGVIFFFFFPFLLLHLEYCTVPVPCSISICVRGGREAVFHTHDPYKFQPIFNPKSV